MLFKTLINLMLLGSCVFAQVEILCSDQFPVIPEVCPDVYDPVCAPSPRTCATTPCPQYEEFPNSCFACSDPNIISFTEGTCLNNGEWNYEEEWWWTEEGCGEEWCSEEWWSDGRIICNQTLNYYEICPDIDEPVCGYYNNQGIGIPFQNSCQACDFTGVDYYCFGECPV